MVTSNYNLELLEKVLEILIFYDLFSFPPTAWEIWQHHNTKLSFLEIESICNDLVKAGVILEKEGFYFLPQREDLIVTRKKRYNYSVKKLKKAYFFSRLFSRFTGIKAIAAANYIGSHNWRLGSDIDLFIITKKGYLWRSRLYCAGLAQLLLSRPTEKKKRDKICLSFYVSEEALDLRDLELAGGDPYFYYWRQGLLPLYASGDIWKKFIEANKGEKRQRKGEILKLGFWENIAKKIQLKIMSPRLQGALGNSSGVLINDNILKLYVRERRQEFRDKFNLKKYEIFKTIN
ncbi:MAG: hypothetical protein PHH52_01305 [Patescibacteria group bacterium]|nr:hypothetical protein [Patescibacteria group bacterium]